MSASRSKILTTHDETAIASIFFLEEKLDANHGRSLFPISKAISAIFPPSLLLNFSFDRWKENYEKRENNSTQTGRCLLHFEVRLRSPDCGRVLQKHK
ncbi:hypothetical protein H6G81_06010 [Scytonema hofmannii FACHB-248]|uniref:Uncharacterized protein n=1 Tax=Scytonema hofmannii FACHB-248 TaxID=1842502 RepID=A0ABR8GLR0_9CYAN|nr:MULTISPECIES: hypothetical protein [Nostocales]MBD2604088.1 hypothetical protein [Scytonema hofmannii FACHB-248]